MAEVVEVRLRMVAFVEVVAIRRLKIIASLPVCPGAQVSTEVTRIGPDRYR